MSIKVMGIALMLAAALVALAGCTVQLVQAPETAPAAAPPETIQLPTGFRPEGIAAGAGSEFFVGSLGSIAAEGEPIVGGAIYRGDLATGQGDVWLESQPGQMAVGLQFDPRTGYLYVAGGVFGDVRVYDTASGEQVARFALGGEGGFVNDLAITPDAVYATDSFLPFLYRVPLAADGQPAEPDTGEAIALGGDYAAGDGSYPFQANGIVATPDGQLIIVNSNTGVLYRVDPATGEATAIDLGGEAVQFGDGLVLDVSTLYVIENFANQIAVVELAPDLVSGAVVATITEAPTGFHIPTTAAQHGDALWVVNARFDDSAPLTAGTPDIDYALVRVAKAAS